MLAEVKRIAVVGSRSFTDRERVFRELDRARKLWGDFILISGGAKGADTFAEEWADARGMAKEIFLPDYRNYSTSRAPLVRNETIAAVCDLMIAYHDGFSGGTTNAMWNAKKRHKKVYVRKF